MSRNRKMSRLETLRKYSKKSEAKITITTNGLLQIRMKTIANANDVNTDYYQIKKICNWFLETKDGHTEFGVHPSLFFEKFTCFIVNSEEEVKP